MPTFTDGDGRRPTPGRVLLLVAAMAVLAACGGDGGTTAPDGEEAPTAAADASIEFTAPEDGATVTNPFTIGMTADGFTIEPAGEVNANAGHFHIMVDTDCVAAGETIPSDDAHLHFGDGQTETELDLEPGEHTLCLQVADGEHQAYDLTDDLTVTVEE